MASDRAPRRIVVVGATGILRPAALDLAAAGDTVVAVARGRVGLTALEADGGRRVEVVPLDVTRPADVTRATAELVGPGLDAAVVYLPAAGVTAFAPVLARVTGPVVRILTSEHARPGPDDDGDTPPVTDDGDRPARESRLLLGWTGPAGRARWHTPEEISAAALDVLARGDDTVLGRLRPWAERP